MENMKNAFIEAAKFTTTTHTENGATALATTSSEIVDQFGKAGNYRGRNIEQVFEEQAKAWEENAELALKLPFYLRMVTRKTKINKNNETDSVQSGQGARDESFKRLLWIAKNHPNAFYSNIWLLPIVGSWKDLWTLMYYDKKEDLNVLDHKAMFNIISQGLFCDTHVDLVKKFMPRIKSKSKLTTPWNTITNDLAKEFSSFAGISYKEYNKTKSSGTAHTFQKLICSRNYDALNWNLIPGRALNLLVTSKFLDNHNLKKKYVEWIMSQPVAKFTGYPFELVKKLRESIGGYISYGYGRNKEVPIEIKHTLDCQFKGLVEKAEADGKITENVLVGLDTSGSMSRGVSGINGVTCEDIASSLAVFFANLNKGAFHNKIMMFDNTSYAYDLPSESFCENVMTLPSVPCGGTNFQSLIDELIKIRRQNPEIPLEDYPTTVIVVSDMQFNGTNWSSRKEDTNHEVAVKKLMAAFPKEWVDNLKFVWWDCASARKTFETTALTSGSYFFSGFDGNIINLLLGESTVVDEQTGKVRNLTAEELVVKALSQEILSYVKLEGE